MASKRILTIAIQIHILVGGQSQSHMSERETALSTIATDQVSFPAPTSPAIKRKEECQVDALFRKLTWQLFSYAGA